jgi:hypothetical protein
MWVGKANKGLFVKNSEKKWLEPASWENVLSVYQTLCQGQKLDPFRTKSNFEKAQQHWENNTGKPLSLLQALEVCQKCHEMRPFVFHNGNVFATVSKQLVDGWAKTLPSVEAQILQTTIGHFVTGQVGRKELARILDFLAPSWEKFRACSPTMVRPQPQPEPQPVAQPAIAPARELIVS